MSDKASIVLFERKEKCCACGACVNVCPKQAISYTTDNEGFWYPEVDIMESA